jgi:S-adenosylmethionine-diacylglycerol 3-amino-3-carboxypropyl transferase
MHVDSTLAPWVAEAAGLPVAFAQVREDPLLDARIVEDLGGKARVIMIASGGCTLAYLVAYCRLARIHVVDPNPAQIALARLKLHLLQNYVSNDRLALLGHAPMRKDEREVKLRTAMQAIGMPFEAIGPPHIVAQEGPDYAGRYEHVFARLRKEFEPQAAAVGDLLGLHDPIEQARRVDAATPLGRALDEAFERAMDLSTLTRLFGEGATRNRVEPFACHFARRTRHALATLPAADNPYLWQILAGRYPTGAEAPWLSQPAPVRLPEITWNTTVMTDALRQSPGEFDFVHLSNILDWLSPEEAGATLDLAHAALRPGGWTLVRQLNSTLDIPNSGKGFTWHCEEAQALHARDRSYFYRALHLGRKR